MKNKIMFNPFSALYFLIISLHFSLSISNANPSVDDKMLIAFIKGQKEMPISEYSMQKYEAHLGIMHFMNENWQCDKIANEFEEYERTECKKYRKYLDILYEYLYREYAGMPTVKPKFVFKNDNIEIDGPIIYAVNCLAKISEFYLNSDENNIYKYRLNKLFNSFFWNFKPIFLNEEKLNYKIKLENEKQKQMPINVIILQLAIDTANECQTNGNANGIIRQNFNKILEEMLIKAEKGAIEDAPWKAKVHKIDKHLLIMFSKLDGSNTWSDDALFVEFVKGETTNNDKLLNLIKQSSESKQFLKLKFESHLGVVYLMKTNWQCDTIMEKFKENEIEKCRKSEKFLQILYEYFFRIFVEGKSPKVAKQLPPIVKPKFFHEGKCHASLISVVRILNVYSQYFWQNEENKFMNINEINMMELVNEEELNYNEINEEKNGEKQSKNKIATKILKFRHEFEQKMNKMCQKIKENAKDEQKENSEYYYVKFGIFISSPFS